MHCRSNVDIYRLQQHFQYFGIDRGNSNSMFTDATLGIPSEISSSSVLLDELYERMKVDIAGELTEELRNTLVGILFPNYGAGARERVARDGMSFVNALHQEGIITMNDVGKLLEKLEGVRQTAPVMNRLHEYQAKIRSL